MPENGYKFPPDREPRGIRFDWTITAGNMLTCLGGLILACGAYVDYRLTMDRHEIRITANESAIQSMHQSQAEQLKYQAETTRALDRLTDRLQIAKP